MFHGNASFKPVDWRIRSTFIYNLNNLNADELAVINPDVRAGHSRFRQDFTPEEYFLEAKLADPSTYVRTDAASVADAAKLKARFDVIEAEMLAVLERWDALEKKRG